MKTSGQRRTRRKNGPWEVLVVAGLFFFPGVFMLFQRGTVVAFQQSFRYAPSGVMALSEHGAHIFGVLAILVGLVLLWFYFYLRRIIARDGPPTEAALAMIRRKPSNQAIPSY